jgi:PAS domain S-box-containing protein
MELLYLNLFEALFETDDTPRMILKANSPDFEIIKLNQSFRNAKLLGNKEFTGTGFHEIYRYREEKEELEKLLRAGLEKAMQEQTAIKLHPYRLKEDVGQLHSEWRQLEITPVKDQGQQQVYLLVSVHDISSEMAAEQREQQLNEELKATNEELRATNENLSVAIERLEQSQSDLKALNARLEEKVRERVRALTLSENSLRSLVMNAHYPLMILRGREWIIEIVNQPLVNLWDKTIAQVTGQPLMKILPEIEDQPFPLLLKQVYDTGIGYGEEEQIFHYNGTSGPTTKYVSFYYDPMLNEEGEVCGIIVSADDITKEVETRKALEQIYQEQQALNDEITTINEELAATVEELSASNDELLESRRHLETKNTELKINEDRFRSLVANAPVGICLIRASDLMVLEVNDSYLELVGKQRVEVENRTIWEAVAEVSANYAPVLSEVIETGIAFKAKEHEVLLIRNGIAEKVFLDFVFEPVRGCDGEVSSVMVVAIEITDKVLARQKIEDVEERIRLALEAAEVGTFDYDPVTQKLISSDRLNMIFDLEKADSREDLLKVIHPDDVILSERAHLFARQHGKMFYEARLVHKDKSIHWIRVKGNLYFDENNKPIRLLGTVLDITEYKFLLQQKDDFISIASHELKTPITSLKASFQLLQRMKDNLSASLAPRLIEQSTRSMHRISELVEDLLNVSRMSEDGLLLNKSFFNIGELLNECCHHVRLEEKHTLLVSGEYDLQIYADEHRIDQVVVNLVNNAVKYAPSSKEIYLNVSKLPGFVKVSVTDNGPGVLPEKSPHLFERYYRADNSGAKVSGLGLGLYISKEIIKRHGGEIGVESEVGKGSTFWFTLPLEGEAF